MPIQTTNTFQDRYGYTIHTGTKVFVCYNIVSSDSDKAWLTGTVEQIETDKRTVKIQFDGEKYARNAMKEQCVWVDAPEMLVKILTGNHQRTML